VKQSLPLSFYKMSGAGNTFTLIDARKSSNWDLVEKKNKVVRTEFAKLICDQTTGLGTDGVLFIQDGSLGFDFDWDFYNSDGSTAEMCGNAARCAAVFCSEDLSSGGMKEFRFKTGAGLVEAQVLADGRVRVHMPEAIVVNPKLKLKTKSSSSETFVFLNTGVPHAVQKIHDYADVDNLKDLAREVRSHEELMPAGTNVTYYADVSPGHIQAVTFERGVEDYTLACGTGAVAAALAAHIENKLPTIEVQMPGGAIEVSFIEGDARPIMVGEAHYIGEFKMNAEVLK
jgi:diaminopimelate epimerase